MGLDERLSRGLDESTAHIAVPARKIQTARKRWLPTGIAAGVALSILALAMTFAGTQLMKALRTREAAPIRQTDFTHGRWDKLSAPPIRPRGRGAEAWTGRELLVWGGVISGPSPTFLSDGAAYNPKTHAWRVLPPGPLSARFDASTVWTGREFVIWGGQDKDYRALADGAIFDPAGNSWRLMTTSPLHARAIAFSFWTGSTVLFWGGSYPDRTGGSGPISDGATYDLTTNRWENLPAPFIPATHTVLSQSAVWTGSTLLTWQYWEFRNPPAADGSFTTNLGMESLAFDKSSGQWSTMPAPPDHEFVAGPAVWTGSEVLIQTARFHGGIPSSKPLLVMLRRTRPRRSGGRRCRALLPPPSRSNTGSGLGRSSSTCPRIPTMGCRTRREEAWGRGDYTETP